MSNITNNSAQAKETGKQLANRHVETKLVETCGDVTALVASYAGQSAILMAARYARAQAPYLEPEDPAFKEITLTYYREFMDKLTQGLVDGHAMSIQAAVAEGAL